MRGFRCNPSTACLPRIARLQRHAHHYCCCGARAWHSDSYRANGVRTYLFHCAHRGTHDTFSLRRNSCCNNTA